MRARLFAWCRHSVRTAADPLARRVAATAILAIPILPLVVAGPARAQVTGTTTQLTTNPAPQLDPAISGDIVVYTDQRNGNDDVYFLRITDLVEVQVTSANSAQRLSDVADGVIVYSDLTAPDRRIRAYRVSDSTTTELTLPSAASQAQNPRIDGGNVVYEHGSLGATDVLLVHVDSPGSPSSIGVSSEVELSPAVSGRRVVYERRATSSSPSQIIVFDMDTASETVLGDPLLDDRRPDIDGELVVWDATTSAGDTDILIHDLTTGQTTPLAMAGNQRSPHVSGRVVSFDDDSAGNSNIVLHHVDLGWTVPITTSATVEFLNDIDGNRVVFNSNASGNNDIWLYEFTIASTGYEFSGFTAPVDAWPVTNSMKAGAAVPVKFSLGGDRGLEIFAAGSPSSRPLSCDANAPTDPVEQTVSAGGSSLAYDAATDTYTYVWKTARSWAGTCRQLDLAFADDTSAQAKFSFK